MAISCRQIDGDLVISPQIEQIGRYRILGVIGQGGMGIVYRALDPNTAREVAIKMPHGDRELLEHFQREVRATASFQHKNIVTVYTVDDFEGSPYMVMEFLDGQSLAETISSGPRLHLAEKLSLAIQVCDGLQYAHELGVIHRDIKPANIYVLRDRSKDVVAKILDFGIARANSDSTLTRTGAVRGSVSYMSPEQLSGHKVDARTDVYSTGVMLYQVLTGELPYKAADPSATFLKILNDPVPSLGDYIQDYPSSLDQILARAMAKSVDDRYQSAEEMGYDLSSLQETLKRGMVVEFLEQAKACASRKEWEFARQRLQEILRVDRHHSQANELLLFVRQEIQHQQRSQQIQQLRSQAQIALVGLHFEEALECLEQACRLDPGNSELTTLREAIKENARRAKSLADALHRGQSALYTGNLEEAESAVDEALQCQRDHTEALALQELIKKEIAERLRRQQLQGYVEEARKEISKSRFLSALEYLQKAKEIDPTDSNIRELLMWASRGHEQEKRRKSIDAISKEVGRLLSEEEYDAAARTCDTGLETFPEEPSLVKLKQLADKQSVLSAKRRFVEDQCIRARHLSDAGSNAEAIEIIEKALQLYPGEDSLTALLGMMRAELEFSRQNRHHSRQILEESTLNKVDEGQRKRSLSDIRLVEQSVEIAQSSAEISILVERAGYISRQHTTDLDIQAIYQHILALAAEHSKGKEGALAEMSSLEEAMRSCQDVSQLNALANKIKDIQSKWPKEKQCGDIAERAAERLHSASESKDAIQRELLHLERSILSAQNLTQISLYLQQAKLLSIELAKDGDIAKALTQIQEKADAITHRVEEACVRIKDHTSQLLSASRLDESERELAVAKALAKDIEKFEEVSELLDKANRRLSERRTDYHHIESGIQFLIDHSSSARSEAEIELILARQRDVLAKYPRDPHFEPFVTALETTLKRRRSELAERAATEELIGVDTTSEITDVSNQELLARFHEASVSSTSNKIADRGLAKSRIRYGRFFVVAIVLFFVIGSALFFLYPRSIAVRPQEDGATIHVDGQGCALPCNLRLRAGAHTVTATLKDHEDFRQSFTVSLLNNPPWNIELRSLPERSRLTTTTIVTAQPSTQNSASISVQTMPVISSAIVFIDNVPVATTDKAGEAIIPAIDGLHSVGISKPGYKPVPATSVKASPTNVSRVRFHLEKDPSFDGKPASASNAISPTLPLNPPATAVPSQPAAVDTFIVLQAPAGSEIHIDQQVAGHSTGGPFKSRVEPGSRTVEVFLPGFQTWAQTLSIESGKETNLVAKLTPVPTLAVPSAPIVSRPASGVSDDAGKQVRQVLDIYQTGFNQRDIRLLQKSYPGMPKDVLSTYKQFFKNKNVSMRLDVSSMDMVGSQIKVEGKQTVRYQDDNGKMQDIPPAKVTFLFTNPDGHWIIAAIPTS